MKNSTSKYWDINEKLVEHVISIARLKLSDEEIKKFTKQLKNILTAFKKIDEVNTTDIKPSFHPQEIKNVMREDKVKKWKWKPLENTIHKEKNYFKGPRTV